ncbi:MAG TPA: histidine phosphatase family protein [Gaiellaceae bacterium]|nr:histidine phosphatase family protein [Gaiellaceae bacterium]
MTTILLARHGETEWNRTGRYQGWADPPLNETGRAQARELAEQLRSTPFDAVYSSDLQRARETAEIVAEPHGVPVIVEPGLREVNVGAWSGLNHSEVEARFPDGERPGGESREQHTARVLAAAEKIARAHPGERILLVSHGGTMRAIRSHVSDEPFHPIANCGVLELHFRDDRLTAAIG